MSQPADPRTAIGDAADSEDYDIRIAADGTWFHEGRPIRRPALVKLFASVLRRGADGGYWLITPAERGRLVVDDAPFVAVAMEVAGAGRDQVLTFRTNVGDDVAAGRDHPIRTAIDLVTGEPRPYVQVRDGLDALIVRAVFYQMADLATEGDGRFGVWSGGAFFALDAIGDAGVPDDQATDGGL